MDDKTCRQYREDFLKKFIAIWENFEHQGNRIGQLEAHIALLQERIEFLEQGGKQQ